MPKIPGVNHRQAVRAFSKAGSRIEREGRKHVVMSDGTRFLTIPRNNPVNAYTMGGIVKDSGLSIDEFRKLLCGAGANEEMPKGLLGNSVGTTHV